MEDIHRCCAKEVLDDRLQANGLSNGNTGKVESTLCPKDKLDIERTRKISYSSVEGSLTLKHTLANSV